MRTRMGQGDLLNTVTSCISFRLKEQAAPLTYRQETETREERYRPHVEAETERWPLPHCPAPAHSGPGFPFPSFLACSISAFPNATAGQTWLGAEG